MPFPEAVKQRLRKAGITEGKPGWTIVANAWLLPPTPGSFGDSILVALQKLMRSFFEYGRQHWTWSQSSPRAAADGGLVKGDANIAACASFNLNFKWLAENCLDIKGITPSQHNVQFLTKPGRLCIDSKWVGNVRTNRRTFADLRCFKFREHHWVTYGGTHFDVCYNHTFYTTAEIIWTKLLEPDPRLVGKGGLRKDQIYRLETPHDEGDHLVMIQQQGPNGWPSWQIVTRDQVANLK